MNSFATSFLVATGVLLLVLPRRWAPFPLLIGSCYMTTAQGIDLGVFYFSVIRILVAVGFVRVLIRGERPCGGFNLMDRFMIVWAAWTIIASRFHKDPNETFVFALGWVYGTLGPYILIRCMCTSLNDIINLIKIVGLILVPLAVEMASEQFTGRNLFSFFGGVSELAAVRNGRIRSQGPFAHSILAGTVGAVAFPLMLGIWRSYPIIARVGLVASFVIVISSASSGPLMSLMLAITAVMLWRLRTYMSALRKSLIAIYLALDVVMQAPAYYLIARIDLTGGSTGFHRAELIHSAFKHFNEWYLFGTDYTRHWMPTGVTWSPDHTDITNYYIKMGVIGGFAMMGLFLLILTNGFRFVGIAVSRLSNSGLPTEGFVAWAFGASLFGHVVTGVSVSYFDQSSIFLYCCLGVIGSLPAIAEEALSSGGDPLESGVIRS